MSSVPPLMSAFKQTFKAKQFSYPILQNPLSCPTTSSIPFKHPVGPQQPVQTQPKFSEASQISRKLYELSVANQSRLQQLQFSVYNQSGLPRIRILSSQTIQSQTRIHKTKSHANLSTPKQSDPSVSSSQAPTGTKNDFRTSCKHVYMPDLQYRRYRCRGPRNGPMRSPRHP